MASVSIVFQVNFQSQTAVSEVYRNAYDMQFFDSTVIFAVDGIATIVPVENSMKKPQQFLGCFGVLGITMIIVAIMHATIGFLGYARFGDEVQGSVTLNLPKGQL